MKIITYSPFNTAIFRYQINFYTEMTICWADDHHKVINRFKVHSPHEMLKYCIACLSCHFLGSGD